MKSQLHVELVRSIILPLHIIVLLLMVSACSLERITNLTSMFHADVRSCLTRHLECRKVLNLLLY